MYEINCVYVLWLCSMKELALKTHIFKNKRRYQGNFKVSEYSQILKSIILGSILLGFKCSRIIVGFIFLLILSLLGLGTTSSTQVSLARRR